ncbi:MAG: hypothetical protein J6Y01_06070 [Spirochaetales bacterium]|nr:hypothetical protein [Spirochaetales bacterium]
MMHDILPTENVYTRIAIHSADVNIAAFNETMRFRSHICGPHIALLQQMMNVGQINDILLSESVYRIVAPYTETEYLTDVSTRCIPKMSVYQLQNLCAPLYHKSEYIDAVGSEIRERLHHLTEQKNPDDKVLILENAHDNLDVDFFDRFYADKTESLFVYYCIANDYGRNFYYDILNDLYNITESILLDNNLHENEHLTQYVDYLKQVFNFNPTDYKTTVGYKAALYSFVMALNTLSGIRPTVIIVENIDLLDNESVGILNHLMASTKKSSVYFVFTSEGKLDNLECRMSSYLPVPNMNLTELESHLSSFVSGGSDYMRSLTEYVYSITQGQMWYTDELLSYLKSNNLLTKLPPTSDIPTDMDEFVEKRFEAVNDEEQDVLEVLSLLGAFVEVDFLR